MSSGWLYFEIGLHLVAVIGAGGGDPLPTDRDDGSGLVTARSEI